MSHNATIPEPFTDRYKKLMSSANSAGRDDALNKFARYRTGTKEDILEDCWVGSRFLVFLAAKRARSDSDEEKVDRALSSQNYTWHELNDSRFHSVTKGFNSRKADLVLSRLAREYQVDLLDLFLEFLNHCKDCPLAYFYTVSESERIKIEKEKDEKLTASDKRLPASAEDRAYHIKAKSEAIKKTNNFILKINTWKKEQQGIKEPDVKPSQPLPKERYATITSEDNWLSPANESFIPFVGREKEIELLDQFANWKPKEGRNNFQIWAIVGPSGAGKTRLLTHWANREEMNGWKAIEVKLRRKTIDWDAIDCPTLISIDYLYGFDDVIADIISTAETTTFKHPVRLLLLDHASPDNMYKLINDPRWGVNDSKGIIEDRFIFQKAPMKLGVTSNSDADSPDDQADKQAELDELLTKIICSVAYRGEENPFQHKDQPEIQQGLRYLKDTQGAQQPLFAALVGDTIKRKAQDDSSETSYLTLNRRELIAFYLKRRNALTFGGGNPKRDLLVSCFIAAATVRRGADFSVLAEAVPEKYESLIEEDYSAFKSLCNTITSNDDEYTLKAFEPDILGETHFLLVLQSLAKEVPKLKNILYQQIASGVGDEGDSNVQSFIAFITRLTNNLSNDDQSEQEVEHSWRLLDTFLDQKNFSSNRALSWAVHMARAEMGFILKQKQRDALAKTYFDQIDDEIICDIPNEIVEARYVGMCIRYDGLEDRYKTVPEPLTSLLNNWDQRPDRDYSSTMLAIWAGNQPVIDYLIETASDLHVQFFKGMTALMSACIRRQEVAALKLIEKGANLGAISKSGSTALFRACEKKLEAVALALIEKDANLGAANKYGFTALMTACRYKQEAAAIALIEKEINLNAADERYGMPALWWACHYEQEAVALALIEKGVDLEVATSSGWTTLMLACFKEQEAVALALIDKGANLDVVGKYGSTALTLACEGGLEAVALALIDKGANLDVVDEEGCTALMVACRSKQEEVALALVHKGVNLNIISKRGSTALMFACCYKLEKTALFLLLKKNIDLDVINKDGNTAFLFACAHGMEVVTLGLLDMDIHWDVANLDGKTALLLAIENGHETIALALIEKSVNLDVVDKEGCTALMFACGHGLEKTALALIKKGADLNIVNKDGKTALLLAIENGHEKIALALIEKGVNLDVVDEEGCTTLMVACRYKQEEVALALIHKGAILNAISKHSGTAIMFACCHELEKTALALIKKGADLNIVNNDGNTAFLYACANGMEVVILALLDMDIHWDIANQDGKTALLLAIENGHEKIALALIEKGVNLDVVDEEGCTALMVACRYKQEEVALALIDKGVNLNAVNKNGVTALMLTCDIQQEAIALALIHSDADLNVKSHSGHTALMIAAMKNRYTIVDALIQCSADMNTVFSNTDSSVLDKIQNMSVEQLIKMFEKMGIFSDDDLSELRSADPSEVREFFIEMCQKETQVTALGFARSLGHTETIKLLEDAGALELPPYNPEEGI